MSNQDASPQISRCIIFTVTRNFHSCNYYLSNHEKTRILTKVQINSKRRMTSQSKHCNDGPISEELLLSGCLVENDSIQLQILYEEPLETTRHNPHKRPRSATPESNDRLQISDSITQNVKLAQGSTGNAKVLLPFWNEYTREESKKWWLPERTDCVISDSSLWDKSLKKMGLNSCKT
ncbi:hypothetical protein RCL_jg26996.t1 [Rhizophagus clarus]|uniref:Uncharacterized protein n=1 Tax=Rhizophagus clarus TaxID=94130 RepID=A0A8H3LMT4_9GLOM|nr:hypothetical protein RCL_jg26996.t1 [Rhizophagus clarus]